MYLRMLEKTTLLFVLPVLAIFAETTKEFMSVEDNCIINDAVTIEENMVAPAPSSKQMLVAMYTC